MKETVPGGGGAYVVGPLDPLMVFLEMRDVGHFWIFVASYTDDFFVCESVHSLLRKASFQTDQYYTIEKPLTVVSN